MKKDKDTREVVVFFAAFTLMTSLTIGKIGGTLGLVMWALGSIIMAMFAYYEYRQEQAAERERAKVRMFEEKLKESYTEEREDYFSQY